MKVFVAGITGETQYVRGLKSFGELILRQGDERSTFSGGRGDITRAKACEAFLKTDYHALLLCDLDMWHPPDMLEKLRSHDKDMVSGHYFSREAYPVHSVAYQPGQWPYLPLVDVPRDGLHRIGMVGMGCVLIKKHVIEAVAKLLPPNDEPFAIGPNPLITKDHRSMGSDYRFFTLAQRLGYPLWMDASVQCEHAVTFWVGPALYDALKTAHAVELFRRTTAFIALKLQENGMNQQALQERIKQLELRKAQLATQKANAQKSFEEQKAQLAKTSDLLTRQIIAISGSIMEAKWILENLPQEFPTVPEGERDATVAARLTVPGVSEAEVKQARENVAQNEAKGFVDDLNARPR